MRSTHEILEDNKVKLTIEVEEQEVTVALDKDSRVPPGQGTSQGP